MSTTSAETRSSAARTRRLRERRRQGTRCVTVDVNQGELDALIVRGYLAEEERGDGAAVPLACPLRLAERHAEASLPPLPDVHDEAYWREWCNNHHVATATRTFSLAAPKQKAPLKSGASCRQSGKNPVKPLALGHDRRRGAFPFAFADRGLTLADGRHNGRWRRRRHICSECLSLLYSQARWAFSPLDWCPSRSELTPSPPTAKIRFIEVPLDPQRSKYNLHYSFRSATSAKKSQRTAKNGVASRGKQLRELLCAASWSSAASMPASLLSSARSVSTARWGIGCVAWQDVDPSIQVQIGGDKSSGPKPAMLEKVVAAVKTDKTKALDMFNKGEGAAPHGPRPRRRVRQRTGCRKEDS